jgi:hypothetical protein
LLAKSPDAERYCDVFTKNYNQVVTLAHSVFYIKYFIAYVVRGSVGGDVKYLLFITSVVFSGSCLFAGSSEGLSNPLDTVVGKRSVGVGKSAGSGVDGKNAMKRIIFGEQKIEGKIRRPQLVLIKADQRPEFPPLVNQPLGKIRNIAALVDPSLIEAPQQGAFQFKGTRIIDPSP